MKITDEWWTAPAESESGRLVMVTGRDDLDRVRATGKYTARVEVSWHYNALPDGMPETEDAKLMEQVDEALKRAFRKNTVGVITGIYTGDGQRDWIIYTYNLRVFSAVFNAALSELPVIPLKIEALDDPDWEEYDRMRDQTYIAPGE